MKKIIATLTASAFVFGMMPAAWAADTHSPYYEIKDGNLVQLHATTDKPLNKDEIRLPALEKVSKLTLDTVLERTLNNSYNMKLLYLKTAALGSKSSDLKNQSENLYGGSFEGYKLPASPQDYMTPEAMKKYQIDPTKATPDSFFWIGPVVETNTVLNKVIEGQGQMVNGINQILQAQREQMKTTSHQLDTDMWNNLLQTDEAIEGIKLQVTAQYVQLLGSKKQISLMHEYKGVAEKEMKRAQVLSDAGLASPEDVETARKAVNKIGDDIQTLENNYRLGLVQLCFDIGVEYTPDLLLEEPAAVSENVQPVVKTDTETLLANSFKLKMDHNGIDEAIWQQQNTVTKNTYGGQYQSVNTGIAYQKQEQTKAELVKKIYATYSDAENAYQTVLNEQRNLKDAQADVAKMKIRYENGFVSKHDFDKFSFKLQQAQTTLEGARLKYFALVRKAEAMDRGFIS
ncbi:TolC family protein [Paenibacillus chitinolyticus]|uniref:TolC family protein n=1 Tax=Paenibacillus chitinolyticus TaxID=79263 RepID=UPI003669C18C